MVVSKISFENAMSIIDSLQEIETSSNKSITVNKGHHPEHGECAVITGISGDSTLISN